MSVSPGRHARCACGALTLEARGEPVRVSVCHCHACQRRSGAPFAAQARFTRDNVRTSGESREFARTADSGNLVTARFCPHCGSTLWYWLAVEPDVLAVPLGAFDDIDLPAPRFSMYDSRRHPWVGLPASIVCRD